MLRFGLQYDVLKQPCAYCRRKFQMHIPIVILACFLYILGATLLHNQPKEFQRIVPGDANQSIELLDPAIIVVVIDTLELILQSKCNRGSASKREVTWDNALAHHLGHCPQWPHYGQALPTRTRRICRSRWKNHSRF